jgi:small subunit ribosomal protein S1
MKKYNPEGFVQNPENVKLMTVEGLESAINSGDILEARATVCDSKHNLIVDLPCIKGIIPRTEGAIGIDDGTTRDIALISKAGKPVCFKVTDLTKDENGSPVALLSRRLAQEECIENYISSLVAGQVIDAKVTHLEQFGCFVDIGCGIPSLIPIDAISVSRISHPSDRFCVGQNIKAVVKQLEQNRVWLTHKELLGTWEENAALFCAGETVSGVVRSVESYGIFVELTPNLAGLAEPRPNVATGQSASVYIKALIPDKMKVKLIIVDVWDEPERVPSAGNYFIEHGIIDSWTYTTASAGKTVRTDFV